MTGAAGAGKPAIELVISDVDGTLVTDDKRLTRGAERAVRRLAEAGIGFTLISSRPPRGMESLVRTLDIRLPFAAFNGGSLVAPDMTILAAQGLAAAAAHEALALLARAGVEAWVFANGIWRLRDPNLAKVALERLTVGFDPTVVDDPGEVEGLIDKIVGVSDDHARLDACEARLRAALGTRASLHRSQPYYLDITAPGAEKGQGVRALRARIGVPLERTAVLGDMANDVPMFRVAGLAIAMGQAPPAVKAAAQAVTLSNAEDGFAAAVDRFILPRAPPRRPPPVLVIMGVSGCGKSTVGAALAQVRGWDFLEGDTLHPDANVEKMRSGTPLTDEDRKPWLEAVGGWIDRQAVHGAPGVVACSALRRAYREILIARRPWVRFVYLRGSRDLIARRLSRRGEHFMPAALLDSQFAALEEPAPAENAIVIDVEQELAAQLAAIARATSPDFGSDFGPDPG